MAIGSALPAKSARAQPTASPSHQLPMNTPVVTITKVKTPWYALPFLLRRGFAKAVPEYQQVDGLRFKYFAHTMHPNRFGGIYLWESDAQARRWFGAQWFARVQQTYKTAGTVDYYPLVSEQQFVAEGYDYRAAECQSVTLLLHRTDAAAEQRAAQGPPGLLRLYVVREGADARSLVLLFASSAAAAAYLATRPAGQPKRFDTPVLLHNRPLRVR